MGNHYGGTRTNKPCQKCGRMMYNVPIARKYCNMCKCGFPCADEDASVKNTNYPLRTWDYECYDWITLENCRTIDDVVWHFNNGDCTLNEARAWCLVNNYPQSELSRRNEDWHSSPVMRHQKKEPWPYRLVAFLNEVIDMILNDILEDFV